MKEIGVKTFPTHLFGLAIMASVILMAGCDDSGNEPNSVPPGPLPPGTISYSGFVNPTFNIYGCTTCHGGSGGFTLTSYQGLTAGGNSGPAVNPGNGAGSLLIRKLQGTAPGGQMPLGGTPLPSTTIDSISTWIDQGALNN
jgi:hypothetical protein